MNTIIMRMCGKYIKALNTQRYDCRDASIAMTEAVKELRDILDNQGGKDAGPRGLMGWQGARSIDIIALEGVDNERSKNNP